MSHIVLLLTLGAGIGANNSIDEAARKDVAFLEGKWSMMSGQVNGATAPGFMVRSATCTAVGKETTVFAGSRVFMKLRYTVDPSKSPKEMDWDVLEGEYRGQKQLGIYQISGNTVKFCFAAPGQARPTEFSAQSGSERSYTAWQKISGPISADTESTPSSSATDNSMPPSPAMGFRPFGGLFSRIANNPGPIRRTLGMLLPR